MFLKLLLGAFLAAASATATDHVHTAVETEMFAIPISPNLFNWTYQEFDQQYRFRASLEGKPELQSWLRYIYSARHHSGFIFGTPPRGMSVRSPIKLQVVGLNRQDYETRRVTLSIQIRPRASMARHEVQLKVDNLNVEDLLDDHKMTRLKDILRTKLWTESNKDLYATFLASAIDLGARMPLTPGDGEGLVVRLGSANPFSSELRRLREEVRPLSRLPACPRDYKRTTVERLFRDAGLTLDWCRFELYNTIYTDRGTELVEYLTELPNSSKTKTTSNDLPLPRDVWNAPSRHALPLRSYAKEIALTVTAPLLLMLLLTAALTAVLCFHYGSIAHKPLQSQGSGVEVCRYGTNNTDQTQLADDNVSDKSLGGSGSTQPYTASRSHASLPGVAGPLGRPPPPAYPSGLHHRSNSTLSTGGHTPDHRRMALEESLQLLNEAKLCSSEFDAILKDPVIDYADTTEDYVPIKPATSGYISMKADTSGYISMKADLDDIDVPELSKYGYGIIRHEVSLDGNEPVKTWFC